LVHFTFYKTVFGTRLILRIYIVFEYSVNYIKTVPLPLLQFYSCPSVLCEV